MSVLSAAWDSVVARRRFLSVILGLLLLWLEALLDATDVRSSDVGKSVCESIIESLLLP